MQCFYYQHSGILTQHKLNIARGLQLQPAVILPEVAQLPYLVKEKLSKYLYDHKCIVSYHPFFKQYMPSIAEIPFTWKHPKDVFNPEHDYSFVDFVGENIKRSLNFHFTQFYRLQMEFQKSIK